MSNMKKRFKRIYVEVTNICNLQCSFCQPDKRQKEFITLDNFEIVINKIKDYTDYIYLHVKGEPLLHPHINEIIEIANKYNLKVNLTTNGTLLDNLTNKNIRQINYSMQSSNDIKETKIILDKLKRFIKDTNIYLSIRLWSNSIKNNQIYDLLRNEFNYDQEIKDKINLANNVFLSIEDEFIWPSNITNKERCNGTCLGLKEQLAILVDGTIVPCCLDNNGDINLGNIYHSNLDDVLKQKRCLDIINGFNNNVLIENLCKNCNYIDRFN